MPNNRQALAQSLRSAAQEADTMMPRDMGRMKMESMEMSEEMCCPKCKYCGPPEEFQTDAAPEEEAEEF